MRYVSTTCFESCLHFALSLFWFCPAGAYWLVLLGLLVGLLAHLCCLFQFRDTKIPPLHIYRLRSKIPILLFFIFYNDAIVRICILILSGFLNQHQLSRTYQGDGDSPASTRYHDPGLQQLHYQFCWPNARIQQTRPI